MNATRIILTVVCLTATTAESTTAAPRFWKNSAGSGNWSVNTNWSGVSAAGADTVAAPANGDTVSIAPTTDVARTITYNVPEQSLVSLTVDLPVAGTNRTTFTMPAAPTNSLTLTSGFIVGNVGRATFNQLSGTVHATSPALDSVVGLNAGSNGIYNLSGGSLSVGRDLVVGTLGSSSGQFNQSGGTVNVASTLRLGSEANSTGVYNVSNSANLIAGTAIVGGNGTGTLSVTGNASVNVGTLNIGSLGTVNLDGGSVRFSSFTPQPGADFNFNSGSITVAGPVALTTSSNLFPLLSNISATQEVTIEGGAGSVGAIINTNLAHLTVRGMLTSVKALQIGSNGNGIMLIAGGGTLFSSDTDIGANLGGGTSEGTVFLEDDGTTWNNSGNLVVGANNSFGKLIIGSGSTVNVGETLTIGPGDWLAIGGGTIRFKDFERDESSVITYTHGTIQIEGNHSTGGGSLHIQRFFGDLPVIPAGKGLTIEGVTNVNAPLHIDGGTFKTGGLTIASGTVFNFDNGVFELTGGTITGLPLLAVPTNGEFRALGTHTLRVAGAAGSTITATGSLTLGVAAAVNGFGTQGTLAVGANTVTLLDANDVVFDSLSLATLGSGASPGTLNAANGLTLDFGGNITGFGTVSTPNDIAKPLINNGHITGVSPAQRITLPGYVKGAGTFDNVNFTGTFSPGLSPTILTVGNVALSATSTLIMELGGTAAGSGYDQLQSDGTLSFDGTLQIALINNFTPTAGQSFNLFDFTTATGAFDTLQLPSLAGLAWNTAQLYTNGIISLAAAGLPGDYNQDGIVDAADYTVWRDNLGSPDALPNDDTPGVGQDDYDRWKSNFGQSAAGGGSSVSVPEPAGATLLVVAILAIRVGNRRQRH